MKPGVLILIILFVSTLSLSGCSEKKTENKEVSKKIVVKRPITLPPEEGDMEEALSADVPDPTVGEKAKDEKKTTPEESFYVARGDESVSMIASREDVYGDPLKWIILYRLNSDTFKDIKKDESFPDHIVPAGTRLITALFPAESPLNGANELYIVNVLSTSEGEKVAPDALELVDKGYQAYITLANVKGHDYTRLRVGFYDSRSAADEAGQEIAGILNISGVWTTRAEESEFNEYGGYK